MTVAYFLKQRTAFIRQFYATASAPYLDRLARIEGEQEPWVPGYSEDGEPPFLEEWQEADESLQVLGRSCVSMLAATLHAYLNSWVKLTGIEVEDSLKSAFKRGWLHGYKAYFARHIRIKFETGPANLAVLEELVLARNQIQHPTSIETGSSHYSADDLRKIPHPFFVDEREMELFSASDQGIRAWLLPPSIRVTPGKLAAALSEVEQFCEWLETVEIEPEVP